MKRGALRIVGLLVLSFALAACGGDDDGDEDEGGDGGGGASPTTASTEPGGGGGATSTPTTASTATGGGASTGTPAAASTASGGGSGGSGCSGTNLVFTHLGSDDTVDITSTTALSLDAGGSYIAYAADFDLDPAGLSGSPPSDVPPDRYVAMVAITAFSASQSAATPEPLEAGTTLEFTRDLDVLTFAVIAAATTVIFANDADATGTLTLTGVGDTLCFEIDYADAEKELSGTFEAAVTPI